MKWLTAILAIIVLWLVGFGIAVQASISNVQGMHISGSPTHFLFQQILYFVIALVGCIAIATINPAFWSSPRVAIPLVLFIIVALLSVHVPGLDVQRRARHDGFISLAFHSSHLNLLR